MGQPTEPPSYASTALAPRAKSLRGCSIFRATPRVALSAPTSGRRGLGGVESAAFCPWLEPAARHAAAASRTSLIARPLPVDIVRAGCGVVSAVSSARDDRCRQAPSSRCRVPVRVSGVVSAITPFGARALGVALACLLASSRASASAAAMPRTPRLLVFDLDACLWTPEMYELDAKPTTFDAALGGVRAGSDVVRLFPSALAVLRTIRADQARFGRVQIAVASSTTHPAYAKRCLDELVIDAESGTTLSDMVRHREIYPGSKGSEHIPSLARKAGVPYSELVFWDDCTYGDNCADVAGQCAGATCVRTPHGLTEELFERGLDAFARGATGVQ